MGRYKRFFVFFDRNSHEGFLMLLETGSAFRINKKNLGRIIVRQTLEFPWKVKLIRQSY